MRRREFITGLGSTAALGATPARAQPQRVRRVGILHGLAETDPEQQSRVAAFQRQMQQPGWVEGEHIRYDSRAMFANPDNARRVAADLLKLSPDLILVSGSLNVEAVQSASRTMPIVFVGLTDPVGAGFVESLARPGGSTTGFASFEYELSIKWLELLKEIAPGVTRVGVLRQQGNSTGIGMWAASRTARAYLLSRSMPSTGRLARSPSAACGRRLDRRRPAPPGTRRPHVSGAPALTNPLPRA